MKIPPAAAVMERQCEEGSPRDLQALASLLRQAAQQRAGITGTDGRTKSSRSEDGFHEWIDDRANFCTYINRRASGIQSNNISNELIFLKCIFSWFEAFLESNERECSAGGDHVNGFHWLFTALYDVKCQLSRLDLTGCYLEADDYQCLGAAIRKSSTLKALRLVELKRLSINFIISFIVILIQLSADGIVDYNKKESW